MNQMTPKRRQAVERTIIYMAMTAAVLLGTALLVFFTLGYRFNRDNGTFLQGGLVQFISKPSGASVTVGRAELVNKTRSKITLNPGSYLVKMNLSGYQEWQKNADVKAGAVLWLNSALLVPTNPETTSLLEVAKLGSTAFRPDGKYLALMEDGKKPTFRLATTNAGKITNDETITLANRFYTSGKKQQFTVTKWDNDSQWLLMRHAFDKKTEFIAVNTGDSTKSVIVSSQGKAAPVDILFDPRSNDQLIVRYDDGSVRYVNMVSGEVSTPVITGVATISLGSNWTVVYTTTASKDGTSSVGYLTLGAKRPRLVAAYPSSQSLSAAVGDYYGMTYMAITNGKTATVTKIRSWPASDSGSPLTTELVYKTALSQNGTFTTFRGQGRFATFQQGSIQTVYDLELAKEHAVPIVGVKKALADRINWSDTFHFWDGASGYYRQYEFDGTNQAAIVEIAPGFDATYDSSQEYLYSVGSSSSGFQLQATKMIVD